jgi:hypothetical protein
VAGSRQAARQKRQEGSFYSLGIFEYQDQFGLTHTIRFAFNPDPLEGKAFMVQVECKRLIS